MVITADKMRDAIAGKMGFALEDADEAAWLVMSYFGFNSVIIDNTVANDDRKFLYELHDNGLLNMWYENVTLPNSRMWRSFYWELDTRAIMEASENVTIMEEASVYDRLSNDTWIRPVDANFFPTELVPAVKVVNKLPVSLRIDVLRWMDALRGELGLRTVKTYVADAVSVLRELGVQTVDKLVSEAVDEYFKLIDDGKHTKKSNSKLFRKALARFLSWYAKEFHDLYIKKLGMEIVEVPKETT